MGVDYSFELISIETYAPQFIEHNNSFLSRVWQVLCWLRYSMTASIISSHTPFGLSLIDVQIGDNNPLTWVTGKMSLFYPRQSFVISGLLRSINLKCNTLVPLADGANDLSTKRLMFHALFFFIKSCKILCKNPFNFQFFIKLQKWR